MAARSRSRRATTSVVGAALALLLTGCATLSDLSPPAAGAASTPTSGPAVVTPDDAPRTQTPVSSPSPAAATTVMAEPSATEKPAETRTPTPTVKPSVTPQPSATPQPTATPKPTTTPTPKPTARPEPTPETTPTPKPRTTLVRGDQGAQVLALQERLTDLGYWLGTPDGSFGSLTQQAVWALQKSAGISRDGVVGPRTKKALADGIRPTATLGGDGVEIDLGRQVLLVVRDGRVRTILNTSTGNGEEYTSTSGNRALATTPKGRFEVYRGVDGPLTNSLGELWRPRFFHRGIAVHGSPNIPPWAASHGCARLSNAAIDMIWAQELMPIGSRVIVR